jgi:hypothetical protein
LSVLRHYCLALLVIVALGCQSKRNKNAKSPVLAKVYGNVLYFNDVDTSLLKTLEKNDSIEYLLQQTNAWVNEQVLLHEAEKSLSEEEKNKEDEIEEYRNNLLLFELRRKFTLDNLDTVINDSEIVAYYEENKKNFELKRNIVKILYVKVLEDDYTSKAKTWMRNPTDENKELLQEYCEDNAENYFLKDSVWLYFDDIWKEIPISKNYNRERFITNNKFLEFKENDFYYLLKIQDFRIKNSISPLEFERQKIERIILNKRRISLINEMEQNIISEAYNKGKIKVTIK